MSSWKKWKDIALSNGIDNKKFWERVNRLKWTAEKSATTPTNENRAKDYKWRQQARKNGINTNTYKHRIKMGWSYEDASTIPVNSHLRKDRKWIELAKKNGICFKTYSYRVDELFWDPKVAATKPPMSRKEVSELALELQKQYNEIKSKHIFEDENNLFKLTESHFKIAKTNGIKKRTVEARVYIYGWTVQEAITIPTKNKPTLKELEFQEMARKNGVPYSTYKWRIRNGISPKEAASKKPYQRNDREWIEKAKKNGIEYATYCHRIKTGWTPKEAATTKPLQPGQHLNDERKERAKEGLKRFRGK